MYMIVRFVLRRFTSLGEHLFSEMGGSPSRKMEYPKIAENKITDL